MVVFDLLMLIYVDILVLGLTRIALLLFNTAHACSSLLTKANHLIGNGLWVHFVSHKMLFRQRWHLSFECLLVDYIIELLEG